MIANRTFQPKSRIRERLVERNGPDASQSQLSQSRPGLPKKKKNPEVHSSRYSQLEFMLPAGTGCDGWLLGSALDRWLILRDHVVGLVLGMTRG